MSEHLDIDRCPADAVLSAFADGTLGPHEQQRVLRHFTHCSECADAVAVALQFLSELPAESGEVSSRPKSWLLIAASVAAACAAVVTWQILAPEDQLAPLRRAASTSATRPIEGWVTGFDHKPFLQPRSGQKQTIPIDVQAAAEELRRTGEESARALHSHGIAALFTGDPRQATSLLARAAAASPENATYWSDLAAAEIALGTATQSPGPFREAVTAGDRAVALSPSLGAAHVNRAAALDHLGDREAATRAYRAALSTSLPPDWRAEILTHID